MRAVAPALTGFVVAAMYSFEDAFLVAEAAVFAGMLSIVFVMGRIEPNFVRSTSAGRRQAQRSDEAT
ncbi:hypothetical protein [Caballeronia grimmiae]|uniref:hypothetical protein n=1 Tax=Caballeronia grimmiae TaxID=1071679 RepID=UPI001FCF9823|nr:hypothetical protein [Caballeronia grimmiae]